MMDPNIPRLRQRVQGLERTAQMLTDVLYYLLDNSLIIDAATIDDPAIRQLIDVVEQRRQEDDADVASA